MSGLMACSFCLVALVIYLIALAVLLPVRSRADLPMFLALSLGGGAIFLFTCLVVL